VIVSTTEFFPVLANYVEISLSITGMLTINEVSRGLAGNPILQYT